MRTFMGGAYRDDDSDKLDYEAALSPLVLESYVAYLDSHRDLPDGTKRDFDNWQGGIPRSVYLKSALRHIIDLWKLHRGVDVGGVDPETACNAVLFNIMGYLYEYLRPDPSPYPSIGFAAYERRVAVGFPMSDRDEGDERSAA